MGGQAHARVPSLPRQPLALCHVCQEEPGTILEHETGETIGAHRGLWFHTVGQRRGLGPVLNNANRARGPWHVVRKDFDANVLYATRSYNAADKARNQFRAAAINWVAGNDRLASPGLASPDLTWSGPNSWQATHHPT